MLNILMVLCVVLIIAVPIIILMLLGMLFSQLWESIRRRGRMGELIDTPNTAEK